jgi:hypothetical protein
MKMMKLFPTATVRTLLGVALPLALTGCAGTPASPDSSATHPANAHADVSPMPPLQPGLLAVTNMVTVKPVTTPAPGHQHGHEGHEAKPTSEEKK